MHLNNEESKRLLAAADEANERMNSFQQDVAAAITDVVMKHFSSLSEMDAGYIEQFGKIMTSHTWRLTEDMDKLRFCVDKGLPASSNI